LFDALAKTFTPAPDRKLLRIAANINDPAFAAAAVAAFREVTN
jgi:uncharacterized protein (UPF0261 family)